MSLVTYRCLNAIFVIFDDKGRTRKQEGFNIGFYRPDACYATNNLIKALIYPLLDIAYLFRLELGMVWIWTKEFENRLDLLPEFLHLRPQEHLPLDNQTDDLTIRRSILG